LKQGGTLKRFKWHITFGVALVAVSALTYGLQLLVFGRTTDTFFYMLQDFAFVPVQVLLVTLVINEMLQLREKSALRHKMNMVIGAFFSEVGSDLLRRFLAMDNNSDEMRIAARVEPDWSGRDFADAQRRAAAHDYSINCCCDMLLSLREFLISARPRIMAFLANPNLLEHETFTDTLWAVSHLTEELAYRQSLDLLPETDVKHLAGDTKRAFSLLVIEWLRYARHLREDYPYMYSLVARVNPFDPDASPIVR